MKEYLKRQLSNAKAGDIIRCKTKEDYEEFVGYMLIVQENMKQGLLHEYKEREKKQDAMFKGDKE